MDNIVSKRRVSAGKLNRTLSSAGALFLMIASTHSALAQTEIAAVCSDGNSADNVTLVGHSKGLFKQTGPDTWDEVGQNGDKNTFTEVRRDDNVIYLENKTRGVQIHLDQASKKVKFGGIGKDVRNLYDFTPCETAEKSSKQSKPGDPDFVWNLGSYIKALSSDMAQNEQRPKGIAGGELLQVSIPGGGGDPALITKLHVYHTDDRVYGLQFVYDWTGQAGVETQLIGGDAGKKTTIELGREESILHSVKGHYAYDKLENSTDPDAHYVTPVMTGLTVGMYKKQISGEDSAPGLSHDDLIEFRDFGSKSKDNMVSPKDGIGFDVHMLQGIRSINACVSPTDRNGRIFALGVQTYGMQGDRSALDPAGFCDNGNGQWRLQPLGPPRLVMKDTFGDAVEGKFDPYEYASGVYEKKGESFRTYKSAAGENAEFDYKYKSPSYIIAEFGDVAEITLGSANQSVSFPLLTDKSKMRTDENYAFQYGNSVGFVGVIIKEERIEVSRGEFETEKYATIIFEMTSGNTGYNGTYTEARFGDGKVASRHKFREDVKISGQSSEGLFEQQAVVKNRGYMYQGYVLPKIDPMTPAAGKSDKNIFAKGGEFKYSLDNNDNLAIPDGLRYERVSIASASETVKTLKSETEFGEALSQSIGFSSPVPQASVSASAKFENTDGTKQGRNRMRAVATAKILRFAMVTDLPNATLSSQFSQDLSDLFDDIKDGKKADANKQAKFIVETYGTHYANSLTFGGLAQRVESVDSKTYATNFIKSRSASASIGGSSSATTTENRQDFEEFKSKNFRAAGGSGVTSFESWNADNDLVPVLYDLHEIHKLIVPIIVRKVEQRWGNTVSDEHAEEARLLLKEAVQAHIAQYPMPENVSYEPRVYELKVSNLKCLHGGDDDDAVQIYGKVFMRHSDSGGLLKETTLYDSEDGSTWRDDFTGIPRMIELPCGESANTNSWDKTISLWSYHDDYDVLSASFHMDIEEYDETNFDFDEEVNGSIALQPPPKGFEPESWAAVVYEGGRDKNEYAPVISIDYTWQRIK